MGLSSVYRPHRAPLGLLLLSLACTGEISPIGGTDEPGLSPDEGPPPTAPDYCDLSGDDPRRVTIRRLNRVEYNNTVRDLLGDTTAPADTFPPDDVSGDGFDNNGEVLVLGDLLLERYDDAARALARNALEAGSVVRSQYLTCTPAPSGSDPCVQSFIRELGLRAWRRPLAEEEVARVGALVDVGVTEGLTTDASLELAVRGLLLSPHFIFRVERTQADGEPTELDEFELASRLSYFLWSSTPDDELLALAADGALADVTMLRVQVERMLADPRAEAFYENFAGQWLGVRELAYSQPDLALYPDFDEPLRDAMVQETVRFVRHVVEAGLPISALLRANFTYLNERLARHYGVEGVTGDELREVVLESETRGGILMQGSVLTVTSHPDTTSPVRRGKWVLSQLMCEPPPEPPADVDTFIQETSSGTTLRERLEQHRADPACATCHSLMDPIGLGFENYDAIGAYRELDNGEPIDPSGELPDGTTFTSAAELADILKEDSRYVGCVTEKLMVYALGRGLTIEDRCFVEDIITEAARADVSFQELIMQVVANDVFRKVGTEITTESEVTP